MTKAKARERAKKRAAQKAAKPKDEKGAQHDAKVRAERPGVDRAASRPFGGQQNIKSAARTGRGAARSR